MISIKSILKIGIGPSSSHTMGPMRAAAVFRTHLIEKGLLDKTTRVVVNLYGSLSATGKGHATDSATIAGLTGDDPQTVDTDSLPERIERIKKEGKLPLSDTHQIAFNYDRDIIFEKTALPQHENGMTLKAFNNDQVLYEETVFSIGGGFIASAEELAHQGKQTREMNVPYPFQKAKDVVALCQQHKLRFSDLILANEVALLGSEEAVNEYCQRVWAVMNHCIEGGLSKEGFLPGGLKLPRRAAKMHAQLQAAEKEGAADPMRAVDWVNMFAIAVNEENAAGARVVTAPTNGACGVVPAVLAYYNRFIKPIDEETIMRYLLTCSGIGVLYKLNASISGAEVGCQGEVGTACSMAAGGLAEIQGATVEQVCAAAEMAMEHNLGLTCDPIAGLVQVPCIERNGVAAMKSINAARMALMRTDNTFVSLDDVIQTMLETGRDMHSKYRETSQGGLAIHAKY